MKVKNISVWFVLILLLAPSLLQGGVVTAQASTPLIRFEPVDQTIDLDQETAVEVWVDDVTHFYGVEFELAFDDAILEGIRVEEGAAFTAYPNEYELLPTNGIVTDTVKFAAYLLRIAKAPPLDGDLHIATITFKGIGAGTSSLTWTKTKLSDSDANPIAHASQPGSITVGVPQLAAVTGQALMEARSDHSGVGVMLSNSMVMTRTTDVGGWYTFTDVPSDTYNITMSHNLYLTTTLTDCRVNAGETAWVPRVTLYGGDLDSNGEIDINDLVILGGLFGSAAPEADINADGLVDIFDAVLIGKNFGLTGPVTRVCVP